MNTRLRSGGLLTFLLILLLALVACDAVSANPAADAPGAQAQPAGAGVRQAGDDDDDDGGRGNTQRCDNPSGGHPQADRLAANIGVSADELNEWFCAGYGIGEIRLAYQTAEATGESVEDLFALRASGLGWGDIREDLGLIGQGDDDDDDDGDRADTQRCDNPSGAHPQIGRLAAMFDVPADELGEWFCAGYGIGEIRLAYQTAEATGESVEELFVLRASGLGWGDIRQSLGLIGQGDDDD